MNPEAMRHTVLQMLLARRRQGRQGLTTDYLKRQLAEQTGGEIDDADLQYCLRYLRDNGYTDTVCGDNIIQHSALTSFGESVAREDYKSPQPIVQNTTNYNITNSQIGVINEGTIRDLHITIGSLREQGYEAISTSLEKLENAITATNQLADDIKQAVFENLSVLTEELLKPPPKRRLNVVRMIIISTIPTLLGHTADVLGIWESELVQQLLTTFGLS